MWIHLVLGLTVAACVAVDTDDFKDNGIPFHQQQWARNPKDPKTNFLLHQEGPNDRRCVSCLSKSMANCALVQSIQTCGTNFSCYTLQAFSVANSLTIFAKGCFPDFLCLLNQGCAILNETRNGTIGSCSFNCCYTDWCNREPDVPATTSPPAPSLTGPVATTGSQTSMIPSNRPSASPETSPTKAAMPLTATPVPTTPLHCGGPLAGSSGNFTSPGYGSPGHLTQSISCTWTITISKGSTLVVNFLKIKLEKCCDNLEVKIGGRLVRTISGHWNGGRDGRYVRSPTWRNYWHRYWNRHWSHNVVKLEIKGTDEEISFTFSSNSPVTRSGFFANYKIETPNVCGGPLTGSFGNFTSPGYPGNYPDNTSCTWTITVSQHYNLKLTFWSLYVERCCDYIKILVGSQEVRRLAGTWHYYRRYGTHNHSWSQYGRGRRSDHRDYNGNWLSYGHQTWSYYYRHGNSLKLTIRGTGEQISIVFVSDYSITKKGFFASYTVTQGDRYYGYYGDETDERNVKT